MNPAPTLPQTIALLLLRLLALAVTGLGWLIAAEVASKSHQDWLRGRANASDYFTVWVISPGSILILAGLTALVFWQAQRLTKQCSWSQLGWLCFAWLAGVAAFLGLLLVVAYWDHLFIYQPSRVRTVEVALKLTAEKVILSLILPIAGGLCGLAIAAWLAVLRSSPDRPVAWQDIAPRLTGSAILAAAIGAGLQPASLHLAGALYGYGKTAGSGLAGCTVAMLAASFLLSWVSWKGADQRWMQTLLRAGGVLFAALLLGIGAGMLGWVGQLGLALLLNAEQTLNQLTRDLNVLILFLPFFAIGAALAGGLFTASGVWLSAACLLGKSPRWPLGATSREKPPQT